MMLAEVGALLVAAVMGGETPPREQTVVFVCEHGSAKSLIAAEWFNRLAREKKMAARAVSRGVSPDVTVPAWVVEALGGDGFSVAGFTPRRLEKADLAEAVQVVAIGVESPLFDQPATAAIERWTDIPPASTQYAASRDAMRRRIEALLARLSARRSTAP
jgi:arsenate reductase (thioredoxin)